MNAGHHRELIPYTSFRDILESGFPFNVSIIPDAEEGTRVIFQNLDFVKLGDTDRGTFLMPERGKARSEQEAKQVPSAKCVVFDLDNTLWEGVLLENENVKLQKDIPSLLRTLDDRGILLSIASKNTKEHALSRLETLGVDEFFLFPKINWAPKSDNVKQIAADLNIGLDTFIFIDDNPFELSEVSQALPAVECLPVDALASLVNHPRLRGSDSSEARARRKMYQQQMSRAEVEQSFSGDFTEFLRSCAIQVTVRTNKVEDTERISELVQRTNQLNFSGRKYSRNEVSEMVAAQDIERHVIECEDRFGSYGIVGFCVVRRRGPTAFVEDFMLSCRVQGKLIESVMFDCICGRSDRPTTRLEVNFKTTERNLPAQQVLKKLSFEPSDYGVGRDVEPGSFAVDFISVRFEPPANTLAQNLSARPFSTAD
jgi:FkbH-like protein